jgi:hypothetical protein
MTNEEAKLLKAGEKLKVGELLVTVREVINGPYWVPNNVYVSTEYGDFNASVCERVAEYAE